MPISASCPQCGKTYQVKDDFAGKKFRCKQCQGVVAVPAAEAESADPWDVDLGSFQDQEPDDDDDFSAPAPPRRPSGKKKSRSSRGGNNGMPATLMIAIACEIILILIIVFNVVRGIVQGEFQDGAQLTGGLCSLFIAALVNGGAVVGYVKRISVIRWIAVALTAITAISCFGCGLFGIFGPAVIAENLPPDAEIEPEQMMFEGIVMLFGSFVRFVLLICLLLRPTSDWFEN